jgi:hypothetical protein
MLAEAIGFLVGGLIAAFLTLWLTAQGMNIIRILRGQAPIFHSKRFWLIWGGGFTALLFNGSFIMRDGPITNYEKEIFFLFLYMHYIFHCSCPNKIQTKEIIYEAGFMRMRKSYFLTGI